MVFLSLKNFKLRFKFELIQRYTLLNLKAL